MSTASLPQNRAPFSTGELAAVCAGTWLQAPMTTAIAGVSTDTRAVVADNAFVALSGERFDGHRFVDQAIAGGATVVIVERAVEVPAGVGVLQVASSRAALGALAAYHRRRWTGQLLAIGGSAGKTTTRRAVTAVLTAHRPNAVHATEGNFNNDIGVPLTLLALEPYHRFAVIEIGTNHLGEVAALAALVRPTIALLTLIGAEHTEGLGSLDGVAQEEGDLFASLAAVADGGVALGNADDERVMQQLARAPGRHVFYGANAHAQLRLVTRDPHGETGSRLTLARADGTTVTIATPLLGNPGVYATLAAIAATEVLLETPVDVPLVERALHAVNEAGDGRLTLRPTADGVLWIDDGYNANPPSMLAGLDTAAEIAAQRGARLLLVLGEMRELGDLGPAEHQRIATRIAQLDHALLIGVAGLAEHYLAGGRPDRAHFSPTATDAAPLIAAELRAGDVVLLKGSRGVGLERILTALYPEGSHG